MAERLAVNFTTGNDPDPMDVMEEAHRLFIEQGYDVDPEQIHLERAGAEHDPSREVERMVADDVRGVLFRTVYGYRKVTQTELTGITWVAWATVDQPLEKSDE